MNEQQNTAGMMYNGLSTQQPLMERYGSVVKELTDASFLLPLMENDLRRMREVFNPEKNEFELQPVGDALLNEEGIANVMSLARVTISNISVLNDLPKDVIMRVMRSLYSQLALDLMLSRKEYGIKRSKDRNTICSIILTPIWLTLNRSREGGERKFLQNKPGFSEPQQQQRGLWNVFRRNS